MQSSYEITVHGILCSDLSELGMKEEGARSEFCEMHVACQHESAVVAKARVFDALHVLEYLSRTSISTMLI